MNPNSTDNKLSLVWVRETGANRFSSDLGVRLNSASLATALRERLSPSHPGIAALIASQILRAVDHRSEAEIHLPFIDRFQWKDRHQILLDTSFVLAGDRLIPVNIAESAHQMNAHHARLLAAGAFEPLATANIQFLDEAGEWSVAAGAAAAWRSAPPESERAYFNAHKPASIALQSALRRLVLNRWISGFSNCERLDDTRCILAYAACGVFHGRPRTDFAWDVLRHGWFRSAFYHSRKTLDSLIDSVASMLENSGRRGLARSLSALDARQVLAGLAREPRPIESMIRAEETIINQILMLGRDIRETPSPRALLRPFVSAVGKLEVSLRRLNRDLDLDGAVSLLLIEATRALAETQARAATNRPDQHPALAA